MYRFSLHSTLCQIPLAALRCFDLPCALMCARHRLLPPARAPKLPFTIEDLTFFLDISYHGSPVFSHVFRYGGGSAVVPYSPDCYVDSGQD